MDSTTALFFWYLGYWLWIGLLFDPADDKEDRMSMVQHMLWLSYPIAIPVIILVYLLREAGFWIGAICGDIKDKCWLRSRATSRT